MLSDKFLGFLSICLATMLSAQSRSLTVRIYAEIASV